MLQVVGTAKVKTRAQVGKNLAYGRDGQSLVSKSEKSRICGCRGRAELVGPGK